MLLYDGNICHEMKANPLFYRVSLIYSIIWLRLSSISKKTCQFFRGSRNRLKGVKSKILFFKMEIIAIVTLVHFKRSFQFKFYDFRRAFEILLAFDDE